MLISKRSRRRSKLFESRFRDHGSGNFPLRQYLRCRDDVFAGSVHLGLLAVFTVSVVIFGRTMDRLFVQHGGDVSPWVRWAALGLVLLLVLALIRRGLRRFRDIRDSWLEMQQLRRELDLMPRAGKDAGEPRDRG